VGGTPLPVGGGNRSRRNATGLPACARSTNARNRTQTVEVVQDKQRERRGMFLYSRRAAGAACSTKSGCRGDGRAELECACARRKNLGVRWRAAASMANGAQPVAERDQSDSLSQMARLNAHVEARSSRFPA